MVGRGSFLVCLALVTSGCLGRQEVGLAKAPITAKDHVPMACVEDRSGRDAELVEGTVDDRAAVYTDEVRTGFSPTLSDPVEVDGQKLYAGQSCAMLAKPVCDTALYFRRGERRYFLYWGDQYASSSEVPTTTSALIEQLRARGLPKALSALNVDDATQKQFAEISQTRRNRERWNLVTFIAAVSAQAAAPKLGAAQGAAKEQGQKAVGESLDVSFQIDDSEKSALDGNPKLAALFAAAKLAAGGSDYHIASLCVGPVAEAGD